MRARLGEVLEPRYDDLAFTRLWIRHDTRREPLLKHLVAPPTQSGGSTLRRFDPFQVLPAPLSDAGCVLTDLRRAVLSLRYHGVVVFVVVAVVGFGVGDGLDAADDVVVVFVVVVVVVVVFDDRVIHRVGMITRHRLRMPTRWITSMMDLQQTHDRSVAVVVLWRARLSVDHACFTEGLVEDRFESVLGLADEDLADALAVKPHTPSLTWVCSINLVGERIVMDPFEGDVGWKINGNGLHLAPQHTSRLRADLPETLAKDVRHRSQRK